MSRPDDPPRPRQGLRVVTTQEANALEQAHEAQIHQLSRRQRRGLRRLFKISSKFVLDGFGDTFIGLEEWDRLTGLESALATLPHSSHIGTWHGQGDGSISIEVLNPDGGPHTILGSLTRCTVTAPVKFDILYLADQEEPIIMNPRFDNFTNWPNPLGLGDGLAKLRNTDCRAQYFEDFLLRGTWLCIPRRHAWWAARLAEHDLMKTLLVHPEVVGSILQAVKRHEEQLGIPNVTRLYSPARRALKLRTYTEKQRRDGQSKRPSYLKVID